ncbi:tensin-1 isoform X5 [Zophobas morio]|uniref:tensin-1 isoform X5 n=1 Tax=Zophobas morio TaxID=2755281 RepID=UPI003083D9E3
MPWIKSCLCQHEKKKAPTISPPIHLLLKHEDSVTQGPSHAFRCKTFKKPRPCHLCHQPILNEGSCCRVCKYVCHKVCESKEAVQRYTDTSWQIHRQSKRKPTTLPINTPPSKDDAEPKNEIVKINGITSNGDVTVPPKSEKPESVEVVQIETVEVLYEPVKSQVEVVLHSHDELAKNGTEMNKVFNLTEPKRALRNEHKHVKEVGWAQNLAPPLEKLCSVCKEIDSWLSGDQHRIAVLHARGNKDKLGVIVAAYMHYSSICGSAEQALDRFSMRRFLDDNVGPLALPSNKRYVDYFAGLLSHNIKINAAPLYLTHVTVLGAPCFQRGGCKAFLKLYEGQTPVYTSGVYNVSSGVSQFTVNVAGERRRGLQLRGDILIKCYHRGDVGRETVFACQFHTCAVADYTLSFTRQELDVACNDPRFPVDGAVELHFSPGPEGRHPAPAPTPAVPFTLADDPITRADSPFFVEEFDDEGDSDSDDVNHTFGPLDGSIYATIAKKPELSPGAVSSPLTVSMDSGISSAGHQQNANTTASASPPLTAQPSPLTPEDQHRELDELVSDMMLTVQSIPDLKPHHQDQSSGSAIATSGNSFGLENVRYIDEEDDKNIPYHARQDSRPFSYGVNSNSMIADSKGLSSPSLVRKASVNKSSGDTLKKVQTQVYPDFGGKPVPNFSNPPTYHPPSNYSTLSKYPANSYGAHGDSLRRRERDPIDDIFTPSALSATEPIKREFREEYYRDEVKRYTPLKRSVTEGTLRTGHDKNDYKASVATSPYSDSESLSPPGAFRSSTKSPEFHESYTTNKSLTWLQKQQLKLKERREVQLREERHPHETRLLSELRHVQSRHMKPTASHRLDGYTSDTTAFADDDEDYTIPLHINTTQKPGSAAPGSPRMLSRTYSASKASSYTSKNERPFMTVKRAHERYAQSSDSSPASILAANPMGQIVRPPSRGGDTVDSGLLSLVEQEQYNKHSPRYNQGGLVGIENDSSVDSSPADIRNDSIGIDALSDLIASLSSGSDKSSNSPNNTTSAWQYREETHTWRSQSVNDVDTSPSHNSSPRPQTPAFPVHVRTPYTNPSTPTVQFDLPSERLPPKSPTTQRRLSCPSSNKLTKKWSLSPERKDRPTSPTDMINGSSSEYIHSTTHRSVSATPPAGYKDNFSENYQHSPKSPTRNGSASPTVYFGNSRRSSVHSNSEPPHEVSAAHVKFVRDTSKYWYKPTISREEAINMLRDQPPGTFVVRDSNSFPGAFGMALKVATIPSNMQNKPIQGDELIRHFLIEPTSRGVKLKGCPSEPVFSSLSALVYQHSVTPLALPCRLILPEGDLKYQDSANNPAQQLLTQGAACNVMYLFTLDMESLTGPEAVRKAVNQALQKSSKAETAIVHFKVNGQGITLTDNKRKLFFRRHYPINTISHCGLDPEERRWSVSSDESGSTASPNRVFGFIARKPNVSNPDNQCHLFAELEPEQPAVAIANFVNKVLTSSGIKPNIV